MKKNLSDALEIHNQLNFSVNNIFIHDEKEKQMDGTIFGVLKKIKIFIYINNIRIGKKLNVEEYFKLFKNSSFIER